MRRLKPLHGWILAAAALGLGLRGAYAWRCYPRAYRPDLDGYEALGNGLVERGELALEPYRPTSSREPGFPLLIASLYEASGGRHAWVVLVAQVLMSLLIAGMIGTLGADLFGAGVGAAAFAGYMLYPQAIYYCAWLFRDTFVSFLFTLAVWATIRAARAGSSRYLALAGAAAGILSITSTGAALGAIPACVAALVISDRARGWKRAVLFLLPVLAATGAWTARNWEVQRRLVLGSTNGGVEIYQAMVVEPDDLGTGRQTEVLLADPFWNQTRFLPEADRNAALIRETARIMRREPGLYARRVAARLVKFWRLWPYQRSYDESYRAIFLVSLVSDAWIVPLGLFGFFFLRRRWREAPTVWFAAFTLTGVFAALHAVVRYRLPLMGFVILSAMAAAAALRDRAAGGVKAPVEPSVS